MSDSLLLVDGYGLIYRAYFAMMRSPLRNPAGENTSAIFGFFRAMVPLFEERRTPRIVVCLDPRERNFRTEMYPEYKANREKTPDDLRRQIPIIEEALGLLGIPTVRIEGFEADDLIASYAAEATKDGVRCEIVSGDKDLLQLVGDNTVVRKPGKSGGLDTVDAGGVKEGWGVRPDQIGDYLALVGDSSDNVPGVAGIGPKTAIALLETYETLEAIYERIGEVTPKGTRSKLEKGRESAFLSRRLVELRRDASVPTVESFHPRPDAWPIFEREGMHRLAKDLARVLGVDTPREHGTLWDDRASENSAPLDGGVSAESAAGPGQVPHADGEPQRGTYTTVTSLEELVACIQAAQAAGRFAFDTETTGLDPMTAEIVGFSLSVASGGGWYVPIRAPDVEPVPEVEARSALEPLLGDPQLLLIGQNIKYDMQILAQWGVTIRNRLFDTMVAAWMIDSTQGSYKMDRLAEVYLNGYRTIRYDEAVGGSPTDRFDSVPIERATEYAAEDADVTLRLYEKLEPMIREDPALFRLFTETEMPLIPVLAGMETVGIRLDPARLADFAEELDSRIADTERAIYGLAGREFNIASTKQLQDVLFSDLGLKPVKKTRTGYSTDIAVLEQLAREHPLPAQILQYRTLTKLKSTYVDALPKMVNERTGRLHTSFSQTGTATGRLASRDPNLQNIPIRDEQGRRVRSAFVPDPGNRFISADYAQIELVVLAHLSGDRELTAAFIEGEDVHRRTGALIFGVAPSEVTSDQRRVAKTINFGVMYGMSAFRLSRELELPRADATAFIDAYFRTYAGIRAFVDTTVAEARRTGIVTTAFGRRRPIPTIDSRNRTERESAERVAVNTRIQGTAADIVKKAMLRVASRLARELPNARLLLQVHDELLLEVPDDAVDRARAILAEEMPRAADLSVPLRVSIDLGATWGELH